jgi:diguanylate cyclase (GGDEF)-like protein/PAS domain S-box-containing protein
MAAMNAKRIAALFLLFGTAWILLSDRALEYVTADAGARGTIQSIKGIAFVLLSTALVYALVRAAERVRQRFEQQIIQERDRLAQVLDVSPAVIYSLKPALQPTDHLAATGNTTNTTDTTDWVVDFVGHNVQALTGYTPSQWQTTPGLWQSLVHPDDWPHVQAAQPLLMQWGKLSHEYRVRHADGTEVWVRDDVALLKNASGQPIQITGAWLDITAHKRLQLAKEASEQRYQQLFQANPFPMWVFDNETLRFLSVNEAALQKYGYTLSEFMGMTIRDIRPPEDVAHLSAYLSERPLSHNNESAGEWLHRKKDGTEFWVEVVGHSLIFNHRPARLVLAQDITDRLQAQARQRLIAQVFETSQEGIFITDGRSHFVSVNQSFTRITGYTMDDLRGQTPRLLRSSQHDTEFFKTMWATIHREGRWEGEVWNRSKTGQDYPSWLTISTIRDDQQQAVQYLGIFTETASRKDAEARIERLANYDSLTDLPNRALLNDRAKVALAAAAKNHGHVAVMQMNVDHFKNINELYGHDAGDEVLQALSRRLVNNLKPTDTVSRLGGDDFIILLPRTNARDAGHVALLLMAAIGEPLTVADHELRITVSLGVAEYPDNGTEWAHLTQAAETAVTQAKREGRNTLSFFSKALHQEVQEALAVERDLQFALERQQLVVHYQPQVSAQTQAIVGVEALVRWQHPDWGLVPPARFIPVAEKAGLIRAIGDWVLQQALADTAAWQAAGLPVVPVAVNLSMAQFRHEDLHRNVAQALADSGLPASLLELELTESVAMEDSEFTIATIHRLKQLGVMLSIDDFGTGYSSLSYLKRFAVDKLKIDQSFVQGLTQDADDEAIVSAVIQLAKSLGLDTIAEGVETNEQAIFLRAQGCDEFQGYLFSRPVPAAALAELLANGLPNSMQTADQKTAQNASSGN